MLARFLKLFKNLFSWFHLWSEQPDYNKHQLNAELAAKKQIEFHAACLEITLAGLQMAKSYDNVNNEVLKLYCDNVQVILLPEHVQEAIGLSHDHDKLMNYVWKNKSVPQPQFTM